MNKKMKKILLILSISLFAASTVFAADLNEGFETWPPVDWTIVQGDCSPTNDITQSGDQFYSGEYSARFSSYSSCASYDTYLVTPELITTDGDQTISFQYKRYSYGSEYFTVGWSSTGTDVTTDFTWSDEISDATVDWQQYSKTDLPIGTKYVAIHYYSPYMYYLYLDDVMGPEVVPNSTPAITGYSLVSSIDLATWLPVEDDVVIVDPVYDYTYLNLSDMTTTLPLMADELNEFFVNTYPEGWFDYWAAKGVIEGAASWQAVMWEIINGNAPIMYIAYDGTDYMLVDGLQYQIGAGELNLRVSGDYLLGDYTYTGTVLGADGTPSEAVGIPLTFAEPWVPLQGDLCGDPIPLTLPVVDLAGTSDGFMDDYSYPGSSYMNGIDIVYEITIDVDGGFLQGSLATVGYGYPGLFILDGCPDGEYNTIYNGGAGQSITFDGIAIDAGTYYVIVSNWPTPNDFEYTLNLEWYEWTPDPGEACETAIPYYNINDPAQVGATVEAYDGVWYEFYLDNEYLDVVVSLLGSDFDTILEVWADCGDDTYIAYNDDWSGRGSMINQENIDKTQSRVAQSQIVFDNLEAGNYYAKVYGYSTNFGDYILNITGVNAGLPDGDIIDNAIPVVFDEFNYFNDFGDQSVYNDDYVMPGYGGDNADIVYALTVPMDALVDVSLLGSDFDTKLAIYASDVIPGADNYLYYNDDYYARSGGNELIDWARPIIPNKENSRVSQSALYDMTLAAGMYWIVVDAYGTETGMWDIEVNWEDACQALECVGTPEGEDMILEGGEDVTNGGCNMVEPLFSSIVPGETVCGMLNNYITATGGESRDMDWYLSNTGDEFEFYEVTVTVDCDFGDAALWLTSGNCDGLAVYGFYNETGYCSYEMGTIQIPAGDFGIIVSTPGYTGYPDGFNYALNVEVAEYIPPEDVFINVDVDYWAIEASWNVYDYQLEDFLYAEDLTFAAAYEMQTEALILDPGMYSVVCYDSYGDGGISGNVIHLMQELTSWVTYAYSEAWFDFEVGGGMMYGDVDDNGAVEAFDTSNVLQYVVGLDPDGAPLPWSDETIAIADVDGNFWVNAYDGSLILQYVVGYIDIFPVEELVRSDAPNALVNVELIDNELIFTANGELYSFEATISSEFGTLETEVLYAVNGNKIALASADVITGEFLRIPVSADEVTIDMVINNATERLDLTSAPAVTSLKSNYPNPFNPFTTIAYDVAEAGNVLIQVYNVKGQLVTTLLNEQKDPGAYTLQWNADGQASGVYFYKMKFGRYTSTKKMILMK
ncbi:MAG: T9SS type A sorting domain-containing protein [Candidatus Stygibacter australis]|nr:T9SS type A sorting domain-containing protein [Candidatus Stygibacter australis]